MPSNMESTTEVTEMKIGIEHLKCDGPNCRQAAQPPALKCQRCRSSFYCSEGCQKQDWEESHHTRCVDYQELIKPHIAGEPIKQVAVAVNSACGRCQVSPIRDVVVLPECQHGFCFSCLKDCDQAQWKDFGACPMCRRISTAFPSDDAEESERKMALVERVILQRAREFQMNGLRVNATKEERKESLNWAVAEIETIPNRASYVEHGWEKTDFDFVGKILLNLFLKNDEYEKALNHSEVLLNELKDEQLRILGQRLVEARGANDRSGITRLQYQTTAVRETWLSSSQSVESIDTISVKVAVFLIMTKKAMALEGMRHWVAALECIAILCGTAGFDDAVQAGMFKSLSQTKSNCLREIGDLSASLVEGQRFASEDRRVPGAHKPLALVHKAMGDMEEARRVVNRALFYEEPWNPANKDENKKLFDSLSVEIREEEERRRKEEAFMEVWEPVLKLVEKDDSSREEMTWSDVKVKGYDMFGDDEANAELMDETAQKLEAAAVSALTVVDQEPTEDEVDTAESEVDSGDTGPIPDETEVKAALVQFDHIKLTDNVVKWLKHSDSKFRGLFVDKITRLAAAGGPDGRKYMKRLAGCKSRIFETYLEQKSGQRILWTFSGENLLIWYVAKHKDVSRLIGRIDDAESRSNRQLSSATTVPEFQPDENTPGGQAIDLGRILLDPLGDTPLKLYELHREDLNKLKTGTWQPSLYLTPEENMIVKKEGTVLLLGRSGTGKTICICNRISHDRHEAEGDPSFKQLFVARSKRICKYVENSVGSELSANGTEGQKRTSYWTFAKLLTTCEDRVVKDRRVWDPSKLMDYVRFKSEVIIDQKVEMDPSELWKQIRTFIKGSIEAVQQGRPLERQEYMDLGVRRCRLSPEQRKLAYDAFEIYERYMAGSNIWDECDRIASLLRTLADDNEIRHELSFYKVYVDEIQDYTQAEVALFFMLCDHGGLFFAGDPAQAVVEGVEFRFEDVRAVAFHLFPGDKRYIPEKPLTVNVNFRSHAGVLNAASAVLDLLFNAFPGSAKELPKDQGLFLGPRPGLFHNVKPTILRELVEKIDGVVLLTMYDREVERLREIVGPKPIILSIRDSKGMEFTDVIIVDFFKSLANEHQKPWRKLLQGKTDDSLLPEMETMLKQLYTAITRCSKRLFVAETGPSDSCDAFMRWCTERKDGPSIAVKQDVSNIDKMKKTHDEWVSTGITYAMKAEETDEKALYWLEKAMDCFELGEDSSLQGKVEAHRSCVHFREKLEEYRGKVAESSVESVVDSSVQSELEMEGVEILEQIIQQGLTVEAARVCDLLVPLLGTYSRESLQRRLLQRLPRLDF